jgi:predicted metalloprotease with PDZ domain
MSAPRHLWSGDWQLESAAAAEELARRRARTEAPAPPEPEPPQRRRRRRRLRGATALRPSRLLRQIALVAVALALTAGAAYGVTSLLGGSGSPAAAGEGQARVWLGMDVTALPVGGVLVTDVSPGGPADRAGIRPGDVVTEVAGQRVESPDDVASAIAPLQPGHRAKVELDRGPFTYTVEVTPRTRPRGSP